MEKDIGKLKKNDFTDIVIRLDDFGGKPGVTIREYVTGDRYTGFTKSGVKISGADFKKFKEMIDSINEKDLEMPAGASPATAHSKEKTPQKKLSNEESGEESEFEDY